MRKLTAAAIAVVLCAATAAHADSYENNSWLNNSWLNNSWLNNSWLNNSWLNNSWLDAGNADGYSVRQMTTWQGRHTPDILIRVSVGEALSLQPHIAPHGDGRPGHVGEGIAEEVD